MERRRPESKGGELQQSVYRIKYSAKMASVGREQCTLDSLSLAAMTMGKVLLVADPGTREQLASGLTKQGFTVVSNTSVDSILEQAQTGESVALLLGTEVSAVNAFDLLRRLRASSRLPVLLLLGAENELDGIIGLELGADDYLLQPINPRVLIARLRAILRRAHHEAGNPLPPPRLTNGALTLDEQTRSVWYDGEKPPLTTVEFDLLHAFLDAPGQPLSREELTRNILGRAFHPNDRSLDVHISNLRKKLGHAGSIQALRGIGYLFTAVVEQR